MPGGSTRVYVVCLAKPHPPSGCSGQRSKVAASQPCWVTYCSLVSAVAWRSCTGCGSARRQPWRILFLSKVARTSPMLVGLEASPDSGSQGKLPATPFAPSHRFRHLLEESIQEKNLADHDGGSEPTMAMGPVGPFDDLFLMQQNPQTAGACWRGPIWFLGI